MNSIKKTLINKSVQVLANGGLVAFPTETVYGLGADACNDIAVASIFSTKKRPRFNPLIVHVHNKQLAEQYAKFSDIAAKIANELWPGPLTLVLPRRRDSGLSLLVTAGLDTVAIRIPSHPTANSLLSCFGGPIAAPSANTSGSVSPTTAEHVEESLKGLTDIVIDDGRCSIGLESTVIDLSGNSPGLLRHGAVTLEDLNDRFGPISDLTNDKNIIIKSPGMLSRHYATKLPLRLEAMSAEPDEAFLAFGALAETNAAVTSNLSNSGDLTEAAANLFGMLRALDLPKFNGIAVAPIPKYGLGRAINDRLRRAAIST
ncbi:MAG: L-threonylcarbamoyladenylate synthase [Alphaproteobacteria bacterium]|nr:L-threonylcarbamoyladenylate synthase [Alphaproteobacteria bacterium]